MNNNSEIKKVKIVKPNKVKVNKLLVRRIESFIELISFVSVYYCIWNYYYRQDFSLFDIGFYIIFGLYVLLLYFFLLSSEAFEFGHKKASEVLSGQIVSLFAVDLITYFQLCLMANKMIGFFPIVLLFLVELVISIFVVYISTWIYHKTNVPHNMVMIYGHLGSMALKNKMEERPDKYKITTTISSDEQLDYILKSITNHDSVILNNVPAEKRNEILKYCYSKDIRTYIIPEITDIICKGARDITLFDTPLLLVKGDSASFFYRITKRLLDILLCIIGIVFFIPAAIIIAIAIKIDDGGPVFYRQERLTLGGKSFSILKFRSMIVDAEKGSYQLSMRATKDDTRVTKVGRFLRKYRIDELPQVFNILKGDMSVVGPRAERIENYDLYMKEIPEFYLRTKVKAGLTGYAQIYGKYNTTPYDKLLLDLKYIEERNLLTDIKIIIMTIQILFKSSSSEGFISK